MNWVIKQKGIDELSKLEELNLNENSISKLSGLKGIINVKSIYISHNAI